MVAGLSLGPMVVRVWRSIFLHVFAINTSQTKQSASSMALYDFCRIFWGVLVMRATPLWKKRGSGLRFMMIRLVTCAMLDPDQRLALKG